MMDVVRSSLFWAATPCTLVVTNDLAQTYRNDTYNNTAIHAYAHTPSTHTTTYKTDCRQADRQCSHQVHRQYRNVLILFTCLTPSCLSNGGALKTSYTNETGMQRGNYFQSCWAIFNFKRWRFCKSLRWKLWSVVTCIWVVWWYEFVLSGNLFLWAYLMHYFQEILRWYIVFFCWKHSEYGESKEIEIK